MSKTSKISRRSAVARLLAVVATISAAPKIAVASAHSKNGLSLFETIMHDHDFTLICEPNHGRGIENLNFLISNDFLNYAKNAGIHSIALEMPEEWQPDVERLRADPKTRSVFINQMKNYIPNFLRPEELGPLGEKTADLIEKTRDWNTVIFYDDSSISPSYQKFMNFLGDRLNEIMMDDKLSDKKIIKALVKSEKQHKPEIASLTHDLMVGRVSISENTTMIENVERSQEKGGTIITVGVEHAPVMKKILEAQQKSVAVVVLHHSHHEYSKNLKTFRDADFPVDIAVYNQFILKNSEFIAAPAIVPDSKPVARITRRNMFSFMRK